MLRNNETALSLSAQLTAEEIRTKLQQDPWMTSFGLLDAAPARQVVGAVKNADTGKALAVLLRNNPAGIVAGLNAAAKLLQAEELFLAVPVAFAGDTRLADTVQAAGLPLTLVYCDHVERRDWPDAAFVDVGTLAAVADVLTGGPACAVVQICGGKPTEVAYGTALSTLLPEGDVKAYVFDHAFFPPAIREEVLTPDLVCNGGVIEVVSNNECIVQRCKAEISLLRPQCCGRCTFCREGLFQHYQIFDAISRGRGKESDLPLAQEIGEAMAFSGNCSLGDRSSVPALTALKHFQPEIWAHIAKQTCPTENCSAFINYYIDPSKCQGCGACAKACPKHCIDAKPGFTSMIEDYACSKCGECLPVCPNGAVQKCSGKLPKLPDRPQRLRGVPRAEGDEAPAEARPRGGNRRRHHRDRG